MSVVAAHQLVFSVVLYFATRSHLLPLSEVIEIIGFGRGVQLSFALDLGGTDYY